MTSLVNNTQLHRFELVQNGQTTFVDYTQKGDILVLRHTEVPSSLSGQGAGSRLVRAVLEKARSDNKKLEITCDFIKHFLDRNPEYRNLLSSSQANIDE